LKISTAANNLKNNNICFPFLSQPSHINKTLFAFSRYISVKNTPAKLFQGCSHERHSPSSPLCCQGHVEGLKMAAANGNEK
jgi:hypothetical protein